MSPISPIGGPVQRGGGFSPASKKFSSIGEGPNDQYTIPVRLTPITNPTLSPIEQHTHAISLATTSTVSKVCSTKRFRRNIRNSISDVPTKAFGLKPTTGRCVTANLPFLFRIQPIHQHEGCNSAITVGVLTPQTLRTSAVTPLRQSVKCRASNQHSRSYSGPRFIT
eukprot:scaffold38250_cov58-Cyclotella_meneghiniana.AAC.2